MSEIQTVNPLQLNIVETCPNRPENYFWQHHAWFAGEMHEIQKSGVEVIDKGDYTYQIKTFTFLDEAAPKATGAHFYIPEGKATNTVLFVDENYRWRARAVSGSGWLLAWHPESGVKQIWISPDLEQNPVVEFGKNWIVAAIASPNCGQLVLEGIDLPEYRTDPPVEMEVKRDTHSPKITSSKGSLLYPLGNYWEAFDRLTDNGERARLMDSGR